jgi:hypothetical protein
MTLLSRYWHFEKCNWRVKKASTKWLPGMFPTHLLSLAKMYSCSMELLRMKPSLILCNILYFSATYLSLKHF